MFDVASAVAYLETTIEMLEQLAPAGTPAALYMSSSGKGQAGLELARRLFGGFAVRGVTATREYDVAKRTAQIANEAAAALGLDLTIDPQEIVNSDAYVGEGYGKPSPEGNEAVRLFARTEGIVLDPIYTGKCAAAMVADVRAGRWTRDQSIVFVHTGGAPAVFTWNTLWTD
jgi:D-cysteine desulfhydrase/L-cysteate sulfo-lyase